ncbi:unnamed protein product [Ectocarpus sp. 12 AP-2014]
MSSKFAPEALHSTLQNLCQIGLPFGGKTIIFSGDWRQVAPVLPFGTESEIVEHAFLSLYLWSQVHRFRLTKCMRDKDDIPCAKPVLLSFANEDGSETTCSTAGTTEFEDLVHKVYPDLLEANHNNIFNDRGIHLLMITLTRSLHPHFVKCPDVCTNNLVRTRSSKTTKTCHMLFPSHTSIASKSPARHRTNSTSKLAH